MEHSADLDMRLLKPNSQKSDEEEDEYLTFQLCEGEVMDN